VKQRNIIAYGVVVAVLGMAVFNLGLTVGLIPLGNQAGATVPAAFSANGGGEALYPYPIGHRPDAGVRCALGFGATLAEPALNALGVTVENLTDGAFPQELLIYAVAIGVSIGHSARRRSRSSSTGPLAWLLPATGWRWLLTIWSQRGIREPGLGQRRRDHRAGNRAPGAGHGPGPGPGGGARWRASASWPWPRWGPSFRCWLSASGYGVEANCRYHDMAKA
jgi:hypothetical protein